MSVEKCTHGKFKPIGTLVFVDNDNWNCGKGTIKQEMECTNCGITTYYTIGEM